MKPVPWKDYGRVDSKAGSAYIKGMTYCVAVAVDTGLVFASDSRTNAGVDQISTYSKMHRFHLGRDRFFVVLSAGNLATTQGVVAEIERDIERGARQGLVGVENLDRAAEYVGALSVAEQNKHQQSRQDKDFMPEASFILGGQVGGGAPGIAHIYAEGNFVHASAATPYLQIGEVKYGRPILDRIIERNTPLDAALMCALVSMDSTMRSSAAVGPPIEYLVQPVGAFGPCLHKSLPEDDAYLLELRRSWATNLRAAFDALPEAPGLGQASATITPMSVP